MIRPKRAAWNLCNIWDGVEQMLRNASCFIILFHVNNSYIFFPKKQVSQTPYMYNRLNLIWASKYHTLRINDYTIINSMTPKNDRIWCEGTLIQPLNASYYVLVAMKVLHMVVQLLDSGVNMNKVISCNIKSWPRFSCVNFLGFLMMKKRIHFQVLPSSHGPIIVSKPMSGKNSD